jgi:lipopolysaccharide export system ATP-binding protein
MGLFDKCDAVLEPEAPVDRIAGTTTKTKTQGGLFRKIEHTVVLAEGRTPPKTLPENDAPPAVRTRATVSAALPHAGVAEQASRVHEPVSLTPAHAAPVPALHLPEKARATPPPVRVKPAPPVKHAPPASAAGAAALPPAPAKTAPSRPPAAPAKQAHNQVPPVKPSRRKSAAAPPEETFLEELPLEEEAKPAPTTVSAGKIAAADTGQADALAAAPVDKAGGEAPQPQFFVEPAIPAKQQRVEFTAGDNRHTPAPSVPEFTDRRDRRKHVIPQGIEDKRGGGTLNTADRRQSRRVVGSANTLTVINLRKNFGRKEIVRGVGFSMMGGEVAGLLGPNGAGKTTIFYMIVGFYRPTTGDIKLNNESIVNGPMYRRARMGIAYLPQEASIFRKLTVEQNIWAILESRKDIGKKEKKEKLDRLIEDFSIGRIRKQLGYTLSGGERRRTEIARALAIEPKFLLLDEPFAGIDPIAVFEIKQIIKRLSQEGIGILITDHNVRDTLEITTEAFIINQGLIVARGDKDRILENQTVRDVYLGSEFRM